MPLERTLETQKKDDEMLINLVERYVNARVIDEDEEKEDDEEMEVLDDEDEFIDEEDEEEDDLDQEDEESTARLQTMTTIKQ